MKALPKLPFLPIALLIVAAVGWFLPGQDRYGFVLGFVVAALVFLVNWLIEDREQESFTIAPISVARLQGVLMDLHPDIDRLEAFELAQKLANAYRGAVR
jgi:hypothetical protein